VTPGGSFLLVTEDGETWMAAGLRDRLLAAGHRCELRRASSVVEARGWDVVFVRSRCARLLQDLARTKGPTFLNDLGAVERSAKRSVALAALRSAGVPTARDWEGPLAEVPFERAVLKRPRDDGRSVARVAERGDRRRSRARVYAQAFIESAWEHKVYLVGDEVFAFRQRPVLVAPDKMSTRRRVKIDPALERLARKAAEALGLELAGVDFLMERGEPKVTDVNSNQGLHAFPEGFPALEAHLVRARRRRPDP